MTKRDYSNSPTIHYILEVNLNNGNVISTHTITTNIPSSYNRDLSYAPSSNQIFGLSDNIIFKYNVTTQVESSFTLPSVSGTDYTDLIVAENRLFVIKRDYNDSPTIHSIVELDINTGSQINEHIFTTNLVNYDKIKSLTFLADTHEICGIIKDSSSPQNFKVVKYNISNNVESNFDLTSQSSTDYDEIISTFNEESLSSLSFENNQNSKIVKAYNILGQEVSIETYNEVIIVIFDNGTTKKLYRKKIMY